MLLIVVCIAYVISDVSTHRLPVVYYEGYFTYLYGASILFLLYVFCFLLQGNFFFKQLTIYTHLYFNIGWTAYRNDKLLTNLLRECAKEF